MIESKKALIVVLILPIIALFILTFKKQSVKAFGHKIELPITGYDPRDLLAGHYLVYRIKDSEQLCSGFQDSKEVFLCLNTMSVSDKRPTSCKIFVRGECFHNSFRAPSIERYYVPQEQAAKLEQLIQRGNASIVVSVSEQGEAVVEELLVNGVRWQR